MSPSRVSSSFSVARLPGSPANSIATRYVRSLIACPSDGKRPLSWPLPHGESVCIDARMMFGPRDQFVHVRFGRVEGAGDTDNARARSAAAREAVTLGDQPFQNRSGQGD